VIADGVVSRNTKSEMILIKLHTTDRMAAEIVAKKDL